MNNSGPLTLSEYLEKPVQELQVVGPKPIESFAEIGIRNLAELLRFYPTRYLDRQKQANIQSLKPDEEATVLCEVVKVNRPFRTRKRNLWVVTAELADQDATPFEVIFFNQPWRAKQLEHGMELAVFGKLTPNKGGGSGGGRGGKAQMSHPVVDITGDQTGRIVAVYSLPKVSKTSGGKSYPQALAKAIKETLSRSEQRGIDDPLPGAVRAELGLMSRQEAINAVHRPETFQDVERAKRRLGFDELLCMQLELVARRREMEKQPGIKYDLPYETEPKLAKEFIGGLPFPLTDSQVEVIKEIQQDLLADAPMHRLLQGDVGSGKTISALAGILCAIEAGHQAAFLVPTEVLAEQHFEVITSLLQNLKVKLSKKQVRGEQGRLEDGDEKGRGLEVHLLTNKITGAERGNLLVDLKAGKVDLVVGTSALIYDKVDFRSLALVVVDEQHRFGVNQRALLKEKSGAGFVPDSLAMTATPIPRTVAMTIYGDLDVSTLLELPPGRLPVKTSLVLEAKEEEAMWSHVIAEAENGNQTYIVCPMIGLENELGDEPENGLENELEDSSGKNPAGEPSGLEQQLLELELSESELLESKLLRSKPLKSERNPASAPQNAPRFAASASVKEVYEKLSGGELKDLKLDILHGQMPFEEKHQVMDDFKNGKTDVLISTTVIEVGIDVPRASVMVILGAYRFGIAQLHQLRGRVGRSSIQSYCYMVADSPTERLAAVAETTDGFELAEKDLELRREGSILGNRQAGRSDLRAASLVRHRELVPKARETAEEMLKDRELKDLEWNQEVEFLLGKQEKTEYLTKT